MLVVGELQDLHRVDVQLAHHSWPGHMRLEHPHQLLALVVLQPRLQHPHAKGAVVRIHVVLALAHGLQVPGTVIGPLGVHTALGPLLWPGHARAGL